MSINLVEPDLAHWGPLSTSVYDADAWPQQIGPELMTEVLAFYDANLVPELACSDAGPDRPSEGWIRQPGRKLVTARTEDGNMVGAWILKDSGIYYPVINVTKGVPGAVPILRALAYKSWESEGDNLYADTSNGLIQRWVNLATSTPEVGRPEGMPLVRFSGDGSRVEWKHDV